MIQEAGNPYLCEQLRSNMAAAVRVLRAAQRSLEHRDPSLAHAVLGLDSGAATGIRPVGQLARADALVERILDLAMRVAELARVAARSDADPPAPADVEPLSEQLTAVCGAASSATRREAAEATRLVQAIRRSDARAAALLRDCEAGRRVCLAS
jgi:hypothetical protein